MRRIASASTANSRGICPVVTGRRSPLPKRSAAVTSRTRGPSTQRSVNTPTITPTIAVAINTSHSAISRWRASPPRRWPAAAAFSDCRADSSRASRFSSLTGARTAPESACASLVRPRSSSAWASE